MGIRSRLAVTTALVAVVAAGATHGASADDALTLTVGKLARTYVLHVPKSGTPLSLVIAFHGHGGTGAGMERLTGFDDLADRDGFVVAYPDGVDRGWNDDRFGASGGPDDIAFTTSLIDALEARYPIDRARVYVAGMSNGAIFSETLACRLSDRIAAAASVAGALPVADRGGCPSAHPISIVEIHGSLDPVVPYAGGSIGTFGTRGSVISVPDTVAFWAAHDGCPAAPKVSMLMVRTPRDGTSVRRDAYAACRDGTSVEAYDVIGAGHVWPGAAPYLPESVIGKGSNQMSASDVIFTFFKAHSLFSPSR